MNPSYDNSFGSFGSGGGGVPQPIISSSEAGDVVLDASGGQKKSKKLLIIGIVAIVFLVVAVLAILLFSNPQKGGNNSNEVLSDAKIALNRYTNYFLYGENKTDEVSEDFGGLGDSYFMKQIESFDGSMEYFENLKTYFENFKTLVSDETQESSDLDFNMLNRYDSELDLVMIYLENGNLTRSGILTAYVGGGETAARDYISGKSAPYRDLEILNDIDYYNLLVDWGDENLSLIILYEQMGCLVDNVIDYNCVVQKADDTSDEMDGSISEITDLLDRALYISENNLYYDLFDLNDYVNEESVGADED